VTVNDFLLVLVAIWIAELPPRWWPVRVPDEVPDDFGPLRYVERAGHRRVR